MMYDEPEAAVLLVACAIGLATGLQYTVLCSVLDHLHLGHMYACMFAYCFPFACMRVYYWTGFLVCLPIAYRYF